MENDNIDSLDLSNLKSYFWLILIVSILIASVVGYSLGKSSNPNQTSNQENKTVNSSADQSSITPSPISYISTATVSSATNTLKNDKICSKYGYAQKWEYLTPYTVKENDNLASIAEEELKDKTRVNEILAINGSGPYVLGSTLYLPPTLVTKSSGNLKQFYGKLLDKDPSYWHLLLSSDVKGQGLLIPSYLFEKVSNKDSFKLGDCLKIFLDDGYEVYTVSIQQ